MDTYTDSWTPENVTLLDARKRSYELSAPSPTASEAATLAVLAAAVQAKAVVEIGAGAGISGLRLLEGMASDGILTTIDPDGSHQSAAKEAFSQADIEPVRARQITGEPSEVLPRLADGAYDMIVINESSTDPQGYLDQALRLLRDGGVVVLGSALGQGSIVADPSQRDSKTLALRSAANSIKDNDQLVAAFLPFAQGLLVAVKRATKD